MQTKRKRARDKVTHLGLVAAGHRLNVKGARGIENVQGLIFSNGVSKGNPISHTRDRSRENLLEKRQPKPVPLAAMLLQHARTWLALQVGPVVSVGRVDAPMAMAKTLMMVLTCILVVGGWLVGFGEGRLRLEMLKFESERCSCECV